ncbi:hypothetical protein [Metabacillus dongyingensis]|uniref:hypothetical protein n=1 Tax=Metabacillus dongyingensis TaxID=2874282 RepID=UPI001CBF70F6|nr:hypothetical protein [Metabacillus dongyingensis]UAL53505.1 hypothetical protein K8L98_06890 [Metabacillus dongyingensis]
MQVLAQSNRLVKTVTLLDAIQETYNVKLEKIHFSKNKDAIIAMEEMYIQFFFNKTLSIDDLLSYSGPENQPVYDLLFSLSRAFYNQYKKHSRVSLDDFLSVSYEKAWETITRYNYQSNYWLYHHLKKNIKHACIDLLRKEGLTRDRISYKHKAHHEAVPYLFSEEVDSFSVEDTVILRDSIEIVVASLSEKEFAVYMVFQKADNVEEVTLEVICSKLKLKHRQKAKRLLDKLRIKMSDLRLT